MLDVEVFLFTLQHNGKGPENYSQKKQLKEIIRNGNDEPQSILCYGN